MKEYVKRYRDGDAIYVYVPEFEGEEVSFAIEPWPCTRTVKLRLGQCAEQRIRNCQGARPDSVGIDVTSVLPLREIDLSEFE